MVGGSQRAYSEGATARVVKICCNRALTIGKGPGPADVLGKRRRYQAQALELVSMYLIITSNRLTYISPEGIGSAGVGGPCAK